MSCLGCRKKKGGSGASNVNKHGTRIIPRVGDDDEADETLAMEFRQFKNAYYVDKFELHAADDAFLRKVAECLAVAIAKEHSGHGGGGVESYHPIYHHMTRAVRCMVQRCRVWRSACVRRYRHSTCHDVT
jgi:hypothetical protein